MYDMTSRMDLFSEEYSRSRMSLWDSQSWSLGCVVAGEAILGIGSAGISCLEGTRTDELSEGKEAPFMLSQGHAYQESYAIHSACRNHCSA